MIRILLALSVCLLGCDMNVKGKSKDDKDSAGKSPAGKAINLQDLKLQLNLPDNFDVGSETAFKLLITLDGELVDGLGLGEIISWSYRCDDHELGKWEVGSDDTIILDSNGETELRFVIKPNAKGDGSWKNCRIVAIIEMEYGDDQRTVTVESDVFVVNAATCKPDAVNDSGLSIATQPTNTSIGRKLNLAVTGADTVKLGVAECNGLSLVHWGTNKAKLITSEDDVKVAELGSLYLVASNGINSVPDDISDCKIRVRSQGVCVTSSIETDAFNVVAKPSSSMSHKFIEAYEYGGRAILNASIGGVKSAGGKKGKYFFAQNDSDIQDTDRIFNNQIVGLDPKPKIATRETINGMTFLLLHQERDEVLLIKARANGCGYVRSDLSNERQAYRCLR